jgi:hypothetical protein
MFASILDRVCGKADSAVKALYDTTGNPAFLLMTEHTTFEERTVLMQYAQTLSFFEKE